MRNFGISGLAAIGLAATCAISSPALAGGEGWVHDDMAAAMSQAKAEGKDILIDYTGSDWCGWCIRLDKEVFSQEMFKEQAPEKFVLVALDFPRDKPQTEEVKAHNVKWREKAEEAGLFQGYPTILLANAEGEFYAKTGYRAGGAEPYMEHLNGLLDGKAKMDAMMEKAMSSEGVAKAQLLDAAMESAVEGIIVSDREEKYEMIIALDADNGAGLKEKYEAKLKAMRLESALSELERGMFGGDMEPADVLAKLGEIEAEYSPEGEQMVMIVQMKVMLLGRLDRDGEADALIVETIKNGGLDIDAKQQLAAMRAQMAYEAGDIPRTIELLDEVIAMAPESDFSKQLEQAKVRIAATMEPDQG